MVKKILQFLDKNLAYLLIIPALLLIVVFSLMPIIQSLRFAFFDFVLNDQQKNKIFFSEHYNVHLADENIRHLQIFFYYDEENLENESTIEELDKFVTKMKQDFQEILVATGYIKKGEVYDEVRKDFKSRSSVVKIDKEMYQEIEQFNKRIQEEVARIISLEPDNFSRSQSLTEVANNLDVTLIKSNYVGFGNFIEALKDSRMWKTIGITLIFTIISVFLELVLGLALALVMNVPLKGKGFIRTTSLIPWAIPTAVAALMWMYMFNGDSGVFAVLLSKLNIIENPSKILGSGTNAMIAVIIADVWKTTPYMALMLLAGLQTIPHTLYESSSIDGANKIQQFFKITLPLLKTSILVALLFRTLDAFRVFDLIYVLTGGGPGGRTETISIYSYQVLKSQSMLGYGSVLVIFMALIVGIISFIYIKILGVKVTQEV